MTGTPDALLVERLAAGDQLAVKALFAAHHLRVYRFVLRLVGREDVAEDIVTEVFLDLCVRRQVLKFDRACPHGCSPLPKAYSVLRGRRELPLDDEVANAIVDGDDTPELHAQKSSKATVLRACLAKLTPELREVMELVRWLKPPNRSLRPSLTTPVGPGNQSVTSGVSFS